MCALVRACDNFVDLDCASTLQDRTATSICLHISLLRYEEVQETRQSRMAGPSIPRATWAQLPETGPAADAPLPGKSPAKLMSV